MTLIRHAEVDGRRVDVRTADGTIVEIDVALARAGGEESIDADGGALLPGLTDHHLHLLALAAARASTPCGPPTVRDPAGLAAALAAAPGDVHGWVRGIGYHEDVAGDLDAAGLDRLHPHRPVRIQHRSGALWILNSRALHSLGPTDHPGVERGPDGTPTGRLWRADAWLRSRLPGGGLPDLAAVGTLLTGQGITAVTDATPDLDQHAIDALASAAAAPGFPRVRLLGAPLGAPVPAPLGAGPYKIVIADHDLPGLDHLADRIRTAHAAGRPVAVHCVTREALVLLLVALDVTGTLPGDRIEHAALVPADLIPDLAHRRLRVITQPGFLADRGDTYLRDIPAADHPDLYRCAGLHTAGVPLALSSDAPYGPLNPWQVIAAAVHRRTPGGTTVSPHERLTPASALAAYLSPGDDPGGPPRRVRPGAPADLVLLDRPLAEILRDLPDDPVAATVAGGTVHVRTARGS